MKYLNNIEEVGYIEPQVNSIMTNNDSLSYYFFTDVSSNSIYDLINNIDILTKKSRILQIQFDLPSAPPVKIHINSDGGDLIPAFGGADRLSRSIVPLHTYVEGMSASAATLLSITGARRYISKNSYMLIHQIRSWFSGTYENMIDEKQNLDLLTSKIRNFYVKNTKLTSKELNELLKRDIYLSAKECVKFGLADKVI